MKERAKQKKKIIVLVREISYILNGKRLIQLIKLRSLSLKMNQVKLMSW